MPSVDEGAVRGLSLALLRSSRKTGRGHLERLLMEQWNLQYFLFGGSSFSFFFFKAQGSNGGREKDEVSWLGQRLGDKSRLQGSLNYSHTGGWVTSESCEPALVLPGDRALSRRVRHFQDSWSSVRTPDSHCRRWILPATWICIRGQVPVSRVGEPSECMG